VRRGREQEARARVRARGEGGGKPRPYYTRSDGLSGTFVYSRGAPLRPPLGWGSCVVIQVAMFRGEDARPCGRPWGGAPVWSGRQASVSIESESSTSDEG
jgi:hypothetical protein